MKAKRNIKPWSRQILLGEDYFNQSAIGFSYYHENNEVEIYNLESFLGYGNSIFRGKLVTSYGLHFNRH